MSAPIRENPLNVGTPRSLIPQPCVLVIFGAAGDLAWRKLLPAMYNLNADGLLPANFAVVGFGVGSTGDPDEYIRNRALDGVKHFSRQQLDDAKWKDISRALFYVEGSFTEGRAFEQLKAKCEAIDQQFGIPGNRVFYLAIPPGMAGPSAAQLKAAGMIKPPGHDVFTRVIVEKPIGRDLDSAIKVNSDIAAVFAESQIYRIDHYLGKETVQNMMVLRFANSLFEPLWNQKYIDHVQITVAESEGVGSRVGYYEGVGSLRDMLQNHMLQVLCLAAMEPPWSLSSEVVRDAKISVLNCLRPLSADDLAHNIVRAQYIAGEMHGEQVPGYRREVGDAFEKWKKPIPADSTTDTFVAMRVFIDNWRWAGVPIYLRTGKRLPKRASEVAIQFKDVPQVLFNAAPEVPLEANVLTIRLQPEESIALRIASKMPGAKVRIFPVKMEFNYSTSFGGNTPEAYERLILDVMAGDATLFMRRDAVEASWKFVMPILDHWEHSRDRYLPEYRAGTWGPVEADRMIGRDNREWRTL